MFSDPLLKGLFLINSIPVIQNFNFNFEIFLGNRCVILCDGFYEWKAPKTPFKGKLVKQPYFIYAAQPAGVSLIYLAADPAIRSRT